MLLQKTFTENCITKKVKKNRGEKNEIPYCKQSHANCKFGDVQKSTA